MMLLRCAVRARPRSISVLPPPAAPPKNNSSAGLVGDRLQRRERTLEGIAEPTRNDPLPTGDLAALLDAELLKLPEKHRAMLIASDLQGRPRKEIARQLIDERVLADT